MKKQYSKPALDVIELDSLDVITTSGIDGGKSSSSVRDGEIRKMKSKDNWSFFFDF